MAYLSRADLDNFAERILCDFVKAEYPKGHICYNVDPTRLAQFYGFNILYVTITRDGSVLGQTSIGEMWTPIIDPNGNDILFFLDGKYTSSADEYIRTLEPAVKSHKILAKDRFIEMWDSGVFTDADKLLVDYIIHFRAFTLGDGWQTEGQIKQIQHWEGMYFLDETLSSNYSACLSQFAENKLVYESAWTEH